MSPRMVGGLDAAEPGPHSALTQTQCQFCHSTDYIVMQPRGGPKQWDTHRGGAHA